MKTSEPEMVVVFWEGEAQFAITPPKVNPGYRPPGGYEVAAFVLGVVKLFRECFGDDWWDCEMLRKTCRGAGLPTAQVPGHDDFFHLAIPPEAK
jgi:hypothetical protein